MTFVGRLPLRALLLLVLLVAALSCRPIGLVSAAESGEGPTYLIGPGDELQINVWAEPELSTSTIVRPDGRISVPLVEDLLAAGRTPEEVAASIRDRLAEYRKDPLVTVIVVSGLGDPRQQIRVVGKAVSPTTIPYRSGMTLLDATIAAGGLSHEADGNGASVVRHEDGVTSEIPVRLGDLIRHGDPTANIALVPGDVIVIPEGFFDGEWDVTYRALASETFSDNIDQDPDGDREAGFVTRVGPGISIGGRSARVVASVNADFIGVYQAGGDDEGFSIDPSIAGTSKTELVTDHVFFDLSGSVERRVLDSRDSTSASGASTSNSDLVAAFTLSPYLIHQLGDFADAEWRYRFSPVFTDSSEESDSLSHEASLIFDSGTDFSSFGWTFSNVAGLEDRSDEGTIKTASTDLELNYALWRGFVLIGAVGYEYRSGDDDEDDNFDGVTWRGGFRYEPNSDLNFEATYGHRDNSNNLDASLNYNITAKTSLSASYSEVLDTGQGREESDVRGISIDPNTGQPIGLEGDPFSFDNDTSNTRTFRLSASHRDGNNTFSVFALKGDDEGGDDGDEQFYEARIAWSRTLNDNLSVNASVSYEHSEFDEDNRTDETYQVGAGLNYQLSDHARAFVNYNFETQDSTDEEESFTENAVTIGLSASY